MRKPSVVLLVLGVTLLTGSLSTSSYAQPTVKEDTPTFYHLVPGTYVNGWPRFTIHYPKDWVELRPRPDQAFRAGAPGPTRNPQVGVAVGPSPLPLEKFVDFEMSLLKTIGTDMTVVSDKPSRLRDGTPAREAEIQGVLNGAPFDWVGLATKKGDVWIVVMTSSRGGRVGEDLKAYLYSLEFQPGFDEPVKVPPDVQAFLNEHCSAAVAHNMEKFTSLYSDRFLNSGVGKGQMVQSLKPYIDRFTSFKIVITDFVQAGDRAYLAGVTSNNWGKGPLREISIIKENGQWRWYGNQRDAVVP